MKLIIKNEWITFESQTNVLSNLFLKWKHLKLVTNDRKFFSKNKTHTTILGFAGQFQKLS